MPMGKISNCYLSPIVFIIFFFYIYTYAYEKISIAIALSLFYIYYFGVFYSLSIYIFEILKSNVSSYTSLPCLYMLTYICIKFHDLIFNLVYKNSVYVYMNKRIYTYYLPQLNFRIVINPFNGWLLVDIQHLLAHILFKKRYTTIIHAWIIFSGLSTHVIVCLDG